MNPAQGHGAMVVNNQALMSVIVLWWLCSLIVVRALLELPFVAPLLEGLRDAIPAVEKAGRGTGNHLAVAAFYAFYVLTTPVAAIWYGKFTELRRRLEVRVIVIMWLLIAVWAFYMLIGIDVSAVRSDGIRRTFHLVLNSSWLGSSFIFLLFCHCLVFTVVCLYRNGAKKFV